MKVIKYLFHIFCEFVSYFFPRKIYEVFYLLFNRIYSTYLSNKFYSVEKIFSVKFPAYIYDAKNIKIGRNFQAEKGLRIECVGNKKKMPMVIIGDDVYITWNCHIGASNHIYIGNNVLIGSNVLITDHSHGEITLESLSLPPVKREIYSKGEVIIGDNVWIGEGAVVLSGVILGKNCIVGANSVVTHSFSDNSIIAGIPAKCIKIL